MAKKYKTIRYLKDLDEPILKVIVKITFPFILIYGLYILLNGHLTPGGGFSGGTILGAGVALYSVAFGADAVRKFFTFRTFTYFNSIALSFYAVVKGYAFMTGAAGKTPSIPLGTPGNILSAGLILPLNICVGVVVGCTIYGLFSLFSEGEV